MSYVCTNAPCKYIYVCVYIHMYRSNGLYIDPQVVTGNLLKAHVDLERQLAQNNRP